MTIFRNHLNDCIITCVKVIDNRVNQAKQNTGREQREGNLPEGLPLGCAFHFSNLVQVSRNGLQTNDEQDDLNTGLPQQVVEQTPKLMRRSKLPIVKAKVGPRTMNLIADEKVFDIIPLKKEVKATVSGLYITDVRAVRGSLEKPVQQKRGLRAKIMDKYNKLNDELKEEKKEENNSSKKKKNK